MQALRIATLVSLGIVVGVMSLTAHAGSVVNGGFESPATPSASFTLFNAGSDIDGWTVVGGQVGTVSELFSQGGVNFHAHSGDAWLDLTGFNANSTEGVEQSVATTAGSTYTLTFFVGNVNDPLGVFGTTSTVDVFIDGAKKTSATNTNGTTQQIWKQFDVDFVAAGSTTTFKFLNADASNDNSNGLDDVSFVLKDAPPPSVPLPPAAHVGFIALAALIGAKIVKPIRFARSSSR